MAKVIKKSCSTKGSELILVNPRSCGIDVGATLMQVCIPHALEEVNNRAFGTTTSDLRLIVRWLQEKQITHVAMEATGVYWIPLFNKLLQAGINTILVNPADTKNYAARKTDVGDAEWLMTLMQYNLVKPSFQINDLDRSLRNCTRQRSSLISCESDCVRRMQKTLEQMNLKLTEVISSITGRSGIRIIEAILNGQTDPAELAKLASNQCRKSKEEIAQALEGTWDEELMFFLHQYYEQYQFYRRQIEDLDKLIDKILNQIVARVMANNGGEVKDVVRTHGYSRSKNATKVNIEELSVQIWGVNLTNIEGVSQLTVLSLMGELGSNFTRDFENAAHFCSWCNLAPTDKITGGQIKSSRMTPRKNNVGLIFRNCAMSIANSRSPLGDFYRRMRAKGGGIYAVCATAHKLATIVYTMVKTQTEYNPEKVSISDQALIKKRIARYEQMITKLKKQIA